MKLQKRNRATSTYGRDKKAQSRGLDAGYQGYSATHTGKQPNKFGHILILLGQKAGKFKKIFHPRRPSVAADGAYQDVSALQPFAEPTASEVEHQVERNIQPQDESTNSGGSVVPVEENRQGPSSPEDEVLPAQERSVGRAPSVFSFQSRHRRYNSGGETLVDLDDVEITENDTPQGPNSRDKLVQPANETMLQEASMKSFLSSSMDAMSESILQQQRESLLPFGNHISLRFHEHVLANEKEWHEERIILLRAELENEKTRFEAQTEKVTYLQKHVKKLLESRHKAKENAKVVGQKNAELVVEVQELRQSIISKDAAIIALHQALDDLSKGREADARKERELKIQLCTQTQTINYLNGRLQEAERQSTNNAFRSAGIGFQNPQNGPSAAELTDMKLKYDQVKAERDEVMRVGRLLREAVTKDIEGYATALNSSRRESEYYRKARNQLRAECTDLDANVKKLTDTNEILEREKTELVEKTIQDKKTLETLQKVNAALRTQLSRLFSLGPDATSTEDGKLQMLSTTLTELLETQESLVTDCCGIIDQKTRILMEKQAMDSEVSRLKEQLAVSERNLASSAKEVFQLQSKALNVEMAYNCENVAKRRAEQLEEENSSLTRQLENYKAQFIGLMAGECPADAQGVISEIQETVVNLTADLSDTKERLNKAERRALCLEIDLENTKADLESAELARERLEILERTHKELKDKIAQEEIERNAREKIYDDEMSGEMQRKEERICELEEMLESLESRLRSGGTEGLDNHSQEFSTFFQGASAFSTLNDGAGVQPACNFAVIQDGKVQDSHATLGEAHGVERSNIGSHEDVLSTSRTTVRPIKRTSSWDSFLYPDAAIESEPVAETDAHALDLQIAQRIENQKPLEETVSQLMQKRELCQRNIPAQSFFIDEPAWDADDSFF